ncbi:MAG: hypothetical protein CL840_14230 [Crocinitomicaceae bacterium]|nr:hypothetical protein [Crocinitomicaceae bacterium]|tara:strand:- start:7128 stop:7736 length:609 start_codon:yes stop_codon:yes gene_type:complete
MIIGGKIFYPLLALAAFLTMGLVSPNGWYLLKSVDPGFKIQFPAKPDSSIRILGTNGGELEVKIFSLNTSADENAENLIYSLNYSDLPSKLLNASKEEQGEYFKKLINTMVYNVHGRLMSEQIIDLNGFPGREVKIDFKEGLAVIRLRIYMVNEKLYMLQVITLAQKDFNTSIFRFLNSFGVSSSNPSLPSAPAPNLKPGEK